MTVPSRPTDFQLLGLETGVHSTGSRCYCRDYTDICPGKVLLLPLVFVWPAPSPFNTLRWQKTYFKKKCVGAYTGAELHNSAYREVSSQCRNWSSWIWGQKSTEAGTKEDMTERARSWIKLCCPRKAAHVGVNDTSQPANDTFQPSQSNSPLPPSALTPSCATPSYCSYMTL